MSTNTKPHATEPIAENPANTDKVITRKTKLLAWRKLLIDLADATALLEAVNSDIIRCLLSGFDAEEFKVLDIPLRFLYEKLLSITALTEFDPTDEEGCDDDLEDL